MPKPREVIQGFIYGIVFSLGVVLISLSLLTILVGVFFVVFRCYGYVIATPLWTGAIFLITGIFACAMRGMKDKAEMVQTLFALGVTTIVLALLMGAHGWYAATMEYYSEHCNEQFRSPYSTDYNCISETGRMSIDIALVVLSILIVEVALLMTIVSYFMLEGGPIGPFEKIEGLPVGKRNGETSRGPKNRQKSSSSSSSSSKSRPKKKSKQDSYHEEGESEPMMTTTSSKPPPEVPPPNSTAVKPQQKQPPPPDVPDPLYSSADDLEPIASESIAMTTTAAPSQHAMEEPVPLPVEYAQVKKPKSQHAVVTSAPPSTAAASVTPVPNAEHDSDLEADKRDEIPPIDEDKHTPHDDSGSESDDEFVQPLIVTSPNDSGAHAPLKPTMEVVRQSLLLKADSSDSEESIPTGGSTDSSPQSSTNTSPRSETAPPKKRDSPASKGSRSSRSKSTSSSGSDDHKQSETTV